MYEEAAGQSEEPTGQGTTVCVWGWGGVGCEVPAPPREAQDLCSLRLALHSPFPPWLVGLSAPAYGWALSFPEARGPSPSTVGAGRVWVGSPLAFSPLHFLTLPTLTDTCT